MFDIIIMDNITIHCFNYCLCCYSNLSVVIYLLSVLFFICHGNSLSLPFLPPPPLSTINCTTKPLKIYVSICIIYAIFTYFSN